MGFELFVQTEKNGAQFHGFLPFLCDLVLLFFFYFMGQSSTWQFLSTFLTHFPLSQNKLIGVSRSHKKDLAQRWLNIFLSRSFQYVEIFSATSFLLLWCDELSFFIKQVLPSRDIFSSLKQSKMRYMWRTDLWSFMSTESCFLCISKDGFVYDSLEILCFFWCASVSVSEEWYSMFPGPSRTLSKDFCSFPKNSYGEITSSNIIWPFF